MRKLDRYSSMRAGFFEQRDRVRPPLGGASTAHDDPGARFVSLPKTPVEDERKRPTAMQRT